MRTETKALTPNDIDALLAVEPGVDFDWPYGRRVLNRLVDRRFLWLSRTGFYRLTPEGQAMQHALRGAPAPLTVADFR